MEIRLIACGLISGILMLGCGGSANLSSVDCPWEQDVYSAALRVIAADSANIADYFVDGDHLQIAVWDTAVSFGGIDYTDLDFTPAACIPDKSDPLLISASAPCRSYSTVGLRRLSNSDSPNFLVKFGRIDSSYGGGGFLIKVVLVPINNGRATNEHGRDLFDAKAYTFCFDRLGRMRTYKRIDPLE